MRKMINILAWMVNFPYGISGKVKEKKEIKEKSGYIATSCHGIGNNINFDLNSQQNRGRQ